MPVNRRFLLSTGLTVAAAAAATSAGPRSGSAEPESTGPSQPSGVGAAPPLAPDGERDQTLEVQAAIDACASRDVPLLLPPGRFRVGHLELRPGSHIVGAHGKTTLEFIGGPTFLTARGAAGVALEALALDGGLLALNPDAADALVSLTDCSRISIRRLDLKRGLISGLSLRRCSGCVADNVITLMSQTGLFCLDNAGMEIAHNAISDCGNNGIQVWRAQKGEDATTIVGNRIERIAARAGGSGENGNGVNVFRADGVLVTSNRIADCAYSAIRGNAASNIQMIANSTARSSEVALYAEFGFEGALIASNLIDGAASGIAVTNFDHGARLAVVSGNLIRNLVRREAESEDKRGEGISIEADATVSGNVIEGAPSVGIVVGWASYMRDVVVAQNLIRNARVGIAITTDPDAGSCLISQNMISGAKAGAIRTMSRGGDIMGPDLAIASTNHKRIVVRGNVAL